MPKSRASSKPPAGDKGRGSSRGNRPAVNAHDTAAGHQRPLLAAAWIGSAICCWTFSSVVVRLLESRVEAYDLSFFRACVSVAITLPLLWQFRAGGDNAMPRQAGFLMFLSRGLLVFCGQLAIYYAIPHLPLGDSTVLNASSPIFIASFTLRGSNFG